PATESDKPTVHLRLRARQQPFALRRFWICLVMQFCPARHDFADPFARKLERARQRFFTIFRELRKHGRKKFGRRRGFGFYSLECAWIRIEFGWRQRQLVGWLVLREQACTSKNQIAPKRK